VTASQATVDWLREWRDRQEQAAHEREDGTAPTSWAPVDLAAVIHHGYLDAPPQMLARSDGACLIYPEKNHVFSGEPESCKGWAALHLAAERIRAGEHVAYLDFEDVAATVIPRLSPSGLRRKRLSRASTTSSRRATRGSSMGRPRARPPRSRRSS